MRVSYLEHRKDQKMDAYEELYNACQELLADIRARHPDDPDFHCPYLRRIDELVKAPKAINVNVDVQIEFEEPQTLDKRA